MDARSTAHIMAEYKLVPSKTSQELLLAVAEGKWGAVDPELDEALHALRSRYEEVLARLPVHLQQRPRNLPFYILVREKYPQFRWELFEDRDGETKVRLENVPKVAKVSPSLLSLLLERVPPNPRQVDALALQMGSLPRAVADALRQSFDEMNMNGPTTQEMQEVVRWIQAGLSGQPLTVFTPVCPDYAYEETGDPRLPYRYTFEGLGSGIGIVASRALKAAPVLISNLSRCGLEIRWVVGAGDFEAFSRSNLERLRVTEAEFIERLRGSQRAIRDACAVPVDLPLITELCGGRQAWERYWLEAKAQLEARDYGASGLSDRSMSQILVARKKLYQAWFGMNGTNESFMDVLIAQAAEYAAMGRAVSGRFGRPLVLGADHPAMRSFYCLHQRLPVLYLRRVY